MCVCALRIVSMCKIFHFINTLITIKEPILEPIRSYGWEGPSEPDLKLIVCHIPVNLKRLIASISTCPFWIQNAKVQTHEMNQPANESSPFVLKGRKGWSVMVGAVTLEWRQGWIRRPSCASTHGPICTSPCFNPSVSAVSCGRQRLDGSGPQYEVRTVLPYHTAETTRESAPIK